VLRQKRYLGRSRRRNQKDIARTSESKERWHTANRCLKGETVMRGKATKRSSGKAGPPAVRRTVVDERFGPDAMRLLTATLTGSVREITDGCCRWSAEKEVMVTPKNVSRKLLPTGKDRERRILREIMRGAWEPKAEELKTAKRGALTALLWNELKEGQVFLEGTFKIVGERHDPTAIKAGVGARDFLEVDRITFFEEQSKTLYSRTLRGKGVSHA